MFGFKNIKSLRDSYLIFLYLVWVCCIGNCKMSNCFSLQKLKKAIATMKWNKLSLSIIVRYFIINITVWKVSKYRVISGTYFPVFWLNTERYGVSLRIQSKYMKTWTRNNSVFGHFSRSAWSYVMTSQNGNLNGSEVLIVFKLTELSRSCSKRIINIFQLSQLIIKLLMDSF